MIAPSARAVLYMITPKRLLANFIRPEDRAYFANPVRVEFVRTDGDDMFWVTDPVRGNTYPTMACHIKRDWQLTRRQYAARNDAWHDDHKRDAHPAYCGPGL